MNRHALNYHTRLHDWYRNHSIQIEKEQKHSVQETGAPSIVVAAPCASGVDPNSGHSLSQDKHYFVSEWCSEVNKTLFRKKRKESPPLYRLCRVDTASAKSMCTDSGFGLTKKHAANHRRVRSAEVFTLASHWAKQPNPTLKGGELLPLADKKKASIVYDKGDSPHQGEPDLCIRNSKDNDSKQEPPLARVNHDCLGLRPQTFVLRTQYNDKHVTISPQSSPRQNEKERTFYVSNGHSKPLRRAKSAAVNTFSGVHEEYKHLEKSKLFDSTKTNVWSYDSKDLEINNNFRRDPKMAMPRPSTGQVSLATTKTHFSNSVHEFFDGGDDGDSTLVRKIIDVVVKEENKPTSELLCNDCSGKRQNDIVNEETIDVDNVIANITKEINLAKRLEETEKTFKKEIIKSKVNTKKVTYKLIDDSMHYSSERESFRRTGNKKSFTVPNTYDDLEDERNLSFESGRDETEDDVENETNKIDSHDEDRKREKASITQNKPATKDIEVSDVITTTNVAASENTDMSDSERQMQYNERESRRTSICFSYKPNIGNLSISNSLLHVLSIDDCKMSMRYSPHKVLEEHEVTDNPRPPLGKSVSTECLQSSAVNSPRNSEHDTSHETCATNASTQEKVAMRLSGQDSVLTSLRSSSAQDVTKSNKTMYQILNDTQDPRYHKRLRPQSACIAKAFNTLINDRKIMRRLVDHSKTSSVNVKTKHASRAQSKTTKPKPEYEGPVYLRANAALRRHMDEIMKDHTHRIRVRYERGAMLKKKKAPESLQNSSERSLSLESLPSVRKGIFKGSTGSIPQIVLNDHST